MFLSTNRCISRGSPYWNLQHLACVCLASLEQCTGLKKMTKEPWQKTGSASHSAVFPEAREAALEPRDQSSWAAINIVPSSAALNDGSLKEIALREQGSDLLRVGPEHCVDRIGMVGKSIWHSHDDMAARWYEALELRADSGWADDVLKHIAAQKRPIPRGA